MSDDLWVWGSNATEPRILHAMIRVADLERSLSFYCGALGMRKLVQHDVPAGKFSIAFVSFSSDYESGAIELTHNWESPANDEGYSHGSGYGHIAIGVPDVPGTCARLRSAGIDITVEPKILFPGGPSLAFVKDPDGYSIELIQTSRDYPGI